MNQNVKRSLFIATLSSCALSSYAQEDGGQSLSQAANDPTALISAYQLQDFYTSQFHNNDDIDANTTQFRGAVPFTLGGVDNIARITVPYVTENAQGDSGISDTTLFNLAVFETDWGRWGAGAVALVPTGDRDIGSGQWGAGPAIGFTAQSGKLLWGAFNQNVFSVGERFDGQEINISNIQPIIAYGLGNGWSLGTSEMNTVYDWDADKFVSIPIGTKLSKMVTFDTTPVQFSASYERNLYDDTIAPRDTFGLIAKILIP